MEIRAADHFTIIIPIDRTKKVDTFQFHFDSFYLMFSLASSQAAHSISFLIPVIDVLVSS